jgi:predicted SprT family Zn-dependent metalloprotease
MVTQEEARTMGIALMGEHGLISQGWKFGFCNRRGSFGVCDCTLQKILVSKYNLVNLELDELKDTILHEIAHALAWIRHGWNGHGHGRVWKMICLEVGAEPTRLKAVKNIVTKSEYTIHCACGTQYEYHRRPKHAVNSGRYRCRDCGSKKNFTLVKN